MKLRITGLTKSYGPDVKALDRVSLEIPPGMFGLLGPNGSGKSTLMRIVATLLDPDEGEVTFGDFDVRHQKDEIRKRLGYLPQDFGVYPRVSLEATLEHFALLKGVTDRAVRREQVHALLHRVNLYDVRRKALTGFSGGMRQRFGVAQALLGDPKLIIVDEPTAGLDPGERNRFYNLLAEVSERAAVILSTHIVEDVRELCPRMAILHRGRLLFNGLTDAGLAELRGKVWKKMIERRELPDYQRTHPVIAYTGVQGRIAIHVFSAAAPAAGFEPIEPGLEDLYFTKIEGLA